MLVSVTAEMFACHVCVCIANPAFGAEDLNQHRQNPQTH